MKLKKQLFKQLPFITVLLGIGALLFFYAGYATASQLTVGSIAQKVTQSMSGLAKLITAGSYVAGFGFAVGAILKFKAHKDNPTQIPVGTPIALIFIAAALIFMPTIFGVTGATLFGKSTSKTGGIGGVTSFS